MAMISFSNDVSWNLYENPLHRNLPKSFWDLAGCKGKCDCESGMDSDLGRARAQILDLKVELEMERKARRKAESANRKLIEEVCKERKAREELTRDGSKLAKEAENARSDMERLRVEFEDERKMMKMVEGLREERVHMKLTEAKLLYEERYNKLFADKLENPENCSLDKLMATRKISSSSSSSSGQKCSSSIAIFSSAESGNPHIKQGIKGFVEFPKVVRAIGSKNKLLESQKAQICILLKQKSLMKSSKVVSS
ncbi:unnamed protein product [Rhodiola kirilowii]